MAKESPYTLENHWRQFRSSIFSLRSRIAQSPRNELRTAACLEHMARIPIKYVDTDLTNWFVGDAFIIPQKEVLESNLYGYDVCGRRSYGFFIETQERAVYCDFAVFVRSVIPYKPEGEGFVRDDTKGCIQSNTDFAKQIRSLDSQLDVFNYLCANAGRTIEVTDIRIVETAYDWNIRDWNRYYMSEVDAPVRYLRKVSVPFFDFAD